MKSNRSIIFTGMFAAVLAVLSQIHIPMPSGMPITLQTYAVALVGFLFGCRSGAATVGIYILLGFLGIPVFSGFSGGPGILLGMTGGFIWGFLFLAAGCGLAGKRSENGKNFYIIWKKICKIMAPAAGLVICHLSGIIQFSIVMEMKFTEAAILVSAPYIIKDAVSVVLAYVTMKAFRRRINIMEICA